MPDPIAALERFVARITPYDPDPAAHVGAVDLRFGRSRTTVELTERAARALCEALERYTDPDDNGTCPNCGARVDRDLHCAACGHVGGIFGQTLVHHVDEVGRRDRDGRP
jgi:hypothetical protein